MIKLVKLLKRSVIYKSVKTVKSKKFFNINNMMNLRRLTSLIKFYIDRVIPIPRGMNLASIFQLSTIIRQLMALVTPEKLS